MTDFQAYEILKFVKNKSKKVELSSKTEVNGNPKGSNIPSGKNSDAPSTSAESADLVFIQNIINCVIKAEAENKKNPMPDLDEDASLAVYFIRSFGYQPGDRIDKITLTAFLKPMILLKNVSTKNG